eukprot:CAMPEP_0185266936 /NCGR_PEP_ID=MMETSP1359-20130426/32843_1 /TAXON_ID=552665 /ORGANISM="Bigelowiella longifila, Strain CCMP242" /LENGTH=280 /DNA_ID=CAMNT_0027857049 /DNA_START=6 /DNA_END=851 /DNA_ORIENTATION=-
MKQDVEGKVGTYYSSDNTGNAYKTCWGDGNIHFGYFPHMEHSSKPKIGFEKAAEAMTDLMIETGEISKGSKVLDLGSGYGKPACDVAAKSQAEVWGVDLSGRQVDAANARAKKLGLDNLAHFVKGSFTDLPKEILEQEATFTHAWAQVSWCHAHSNIDDILKEAFKSLKKGGKLVVNDFLGTDEKVSDNTKEHVWKRLHFNALLGPNAWKKKVEQAGFEIKKYMDLSKHLNHGYALLAEEADKHKFKSEDGALLADNYRVSSEVCGQGQIGMNLCIAIKS